ncbi:PIN domain-containing protein [Pseudomonas sp. DTU12.3]|uniref:PIN domain-containing protein n=1 Tax=Pseudomonas sp. DTU12.3 TaxID=2073078 RepID=UPI0013E98FF2|nr:PIN domain-containing protein [Pseudomonas sp. DTU12.3]
MIKHFILDTNVLVQHPDILAMAAGNNLVIPQVVLDQFKQRRSRGVNGGVQEVIDEAIKKGVRIAQAPFQLVTEPVVSPKDAHRLDHTDLEIARIVQYYAELDGKASVCLVTADNFLTKFIKYYGLRCISGAELLGELRDVAIDKSIEATARNIISKQQRYLITSFLLGIVVTILGILTFINLQLLISSISVWGTLFVLPMLGIGLYWYREHYRLSYGFFEFGAGLVMAYNVVIPDFDYSSFSVIKAIQILAGLYVMVRGLDNIGKSVEGTRLEQIWKKIFN